MEWDAADMADMKATAGTEMKGQSMKNMVSELMKKKKRKEGTDAAENTSGKLVVGDFFCDFFCSLCSLWSCRASEAAWNVGIS